MNQGMIRHISAKNCLTPSPPKKKKKNFPILLRDPIMAQPPQHWRCFCTMLKGLTA
jgi:hypothetical protein